MCKESADAGDLSYDLRWGKSLKPRMAAHSSVLALEDQMDGEPGRVTESDTAGN